MHHVLRNAVVASMIFCSFACTHRSAPSTSKKLIKYGQDWPNTAYVRQNISEMEKLPFDGVVIGVTKSREAKLGGDSDVPGYRVFGHEKIDAEQYAHAIEDLKATQFKKFTDNFLLVESMPGNIDWFSDVDFDNVLHNISFVAHVAKAGGCVGIEFDPEEYGAEHVWSPVAWTAARRGSHTDAEFVAKAKERGQQFMHAVNSQFPNIKIFFLFGPTLSYQHKLYDQKYYLLLAPFIEGMCQAADAGTKITDAYEQSYGYRTLLSFESGRRTVLSSREMFEDKAAYDRVMRVGFGLWLDNNSGKRGWYPDEPKRNHFQPNTWQNAVNGALRYSDEYVWLWNERLNWWKNEHMSAAYIDATRAGKRVPAEFVVTQTPLTPEQTKLIYVAAKMGGTDDESTFGDLLKSNDTLLDLASSSWWFRPDPQNLGRSHKWFDRTVDASQWQPIEIAKFWEEQGWDYDGMAWYRTTIHLDAPPANKKITLAFGAADEDTIVWLNGEKIGAHEKGEIGWDEPFEFDVTGKLHAGDNQLSVRIFDRTGPGGIWKTIKVLASK